MKDRILNTLMMLTVTAALVLTLIRGAPEADAPFGAPIAAALPSAVPVATPHPADAYRLERRETRRLEQAMLQALIDSDSAASDTKALAEQQLLAAAKQMETELAVEAALAGKGYDKALCVARDGTVTVMTGTALGEQDAALLLRLIREASGAAAENIRMTGF